MLTEKLLHIALVLCSIYSIYTIVRSFVYPRLLDKLTKEVERNPSWLVDKLRSEYYGFNDIDIIISNCPICSVPRFRVSKSGKLELYVPEDYSVWTRDKIAQIALIGKIHIRHGISVGADKPVYWLSILCYMLDGGDINVSEITWEEKRQENS